MNDDKRCGTCKRWSQILRNCGCEVDDQVDGESHVLDLFAADHQCHRPKDWRAK